MSIGTKKFLSMLDQELAEDDSISENQRKILKNICERIYVLETTGESSQLPTSIREEIKFYAKDFEA
jgi:hypothetical protein